MSFPRRRVVFVLVLGRLVCLEALQEDPGWFLSGRILGNLRQTVTQPQRSPFPGQVLKFLPATC